MSKQMVSFRLQEESVRWLREHVEDGERTALLEELITAYRERRLVVTASPAPSEVLRGEDSRRPLRISYDPSDFDPHSDSNE